MGNKDKLLVYHRADALSLAVHDVADAMCDYRSPGLRAQLLKAIASIPSNVGEGSGQRTKRHFAHYVTTAIASAHEAEGHLKLARSLEMLPAGRTDELLAELIEVRRMLYGLRKHLS
jgi:four helix bundle protein